MPRRTTTGGVLATLLAVVVLVLTSCSEDQPKAAPTPRPTTPSAAPSTTAPPPVAPKVGSCHRFTLRQATRPTDSRAAVGCAQPHTSVTVYVGTFDPVVDGHLLAVDSQAVQDQLAKRCPGKLPAFLGGDTEAQRLSRFKVVWFGPTVAQADAGAQWFRCDVVALADEGVLAHLGSDARGALGTPAGLDRYGTCATSAPDSKTFTHIICQRRHSWQAVSTVDLTGARYLGKAAQAGAESTCSDQAASRANGSLSYTSGFEWPTRREWDAGQRFGYCWVKA